MIPQAFGCLSVGTRAGCRCLGEGHRRRVLTHNTRKLSEVSPSEESWSAVIKDIESHWRCYNRDLGILGRLSLTSSNTGLWDAWGST
ncbi:hypothetical protein QL285_095653 [Trifolium repens]|nr:hypothetical protein QL285_095653 [Trifolium repens]